MNITEIERTLAEATQAVNDYKAAKAAMKQKLASIILLEKLADLTSTPTLQSEPQTKRSKRAPHNRRLKVSEETQAEIKKRYRAGETQAQIGIEFNVSQPTVWKIVHGKYDTHKNPEKPEPSNSMDSHILDYLDRGFTKQQAADKFGLSATTVWRIVENQNKRTNRK